MGRPRRHTLRDDTDMPRSLCSAGLLTLCLFAVESPAAAQVNHDPAAARLVTDDIPRFWQAFDARTSVGTEAAIDSLYFRPASPGLRDWIWLRLQNAKALASVVDAVPGYYASARASTLQIARDEPKIRAAFTRLSVLYPDAVFPDVYFVIGRLTSGGTTSRRGLLIGAEMYGRTADSVLTRLSPWLQQVIAPVDDVPAIVSHELVHYQQRLKGNGLLASALREGSADFVAELMCGGNINARVHAWVNAHRMREAMLWNEFVRDTATNDLAPWFSPPDISVRPKDLGYYMGYRIAQAFYDRQPDKRAAVRQILEATDATAFLRESGYGDRFAPTPGNGGASR